MYGLSSVLGQNGLQRGQRTCVRTNDLRRIAQAAHGTLDHFVGDGMGEEDHEIGTADPVVHAPLHFAEDFCFAAVFLAQVLILTLHTFITADDDNTHEYFSDLLWCS